MGEGATSKKNSTMPAAPMEGRKMKVVEKERGGHLYKNDAMSMEVREVKRVGRGGHLYKNGAMPVVTKEVRKEEVGKPRAGPTTVALATSPEAAGYRIRLG